ncbi:hypothetical protein GCM10009555_013640 [Acrocarpospora macrocephala]|uniref:Uncharacterized protein n=1 Tax=Acrocarpospora macrocephala TaxID=150177 RepID=A0A5M3WMS7_9ACTN|nr:hypothetical protein Amac_017680 [Acrocarpospora macrocephala]
MISRPGSVAGQAPTLGDPMSASALTRLSTPRTVASLERAGICWTEIDRRRTRVDFAHPLYAEYVRHSTPLITRRE